MPTAQREDMAHDQCTDDAVAFETTTPAMKKK